ncbi:hypothetical protein O3M35_000417 [Rhynocoris fuscipes]|uniref:Uncharacterized protein n=1 Tax=Rhynocoris fuscipes TaxID=488301 RepID=A0AAW1DRD7_9HEMI
MESLTNKEYTCYEEVYAVDDEGTARYADIIAFKPITYIIDPTVRYEVNDPNQAELIHQKKGAIYNQCISFYKDKYGEQYGDRDYRVFGLWFDARGLSSQEDSHFFWKVLGSTMEF